MGLKQTQRLSVLCYKSDAKSLLDYLSKTRLFHPEINATGERLKAYEEEASLKQTLSKIEYCLKKIEPFVEKNGIRGLVEDNRPELTIEQVIKIANSTDVNRIYEEISSLTEKIDEIQEEIVFLEKEKEKLYPLKEIRIKKSVLNNNNRNFFSVYLIKGSKADYEQFLTTVPELAGVMKITDGYEKRKGTVYFLVAAHKEVEEELKRLIADFKLKIIDFPEDMKDEETVSDYLDSILLKIIELREKLTELYSRLKAYTEKYEELLVAYEFFDSEIEKFEKSQLFFETEKCVLIEGWVPEDNVKRLKEELESRFFCEVFVESTSNSTSRPVILKNKGVFRSLQFLTELYGNPSETEPDPTPVIAPYFLTFFGFCLGDAGYGLFLLLLGIFLKLKFKLKDIVRAFADIFIYGGIGALIFGILSGSYFALDMSLIPKFLLKFKVFDPIENPVNILGLSLIFGFLHVVTGIALNAFLLFKNERHHKTYLSEIGKILLLSGAVIFVAMFFTGIKSNILSRISTYFILSGSLLIIGFSSGGAKSFIRKVFSGAYNLYGMSSYLGDLSSYARLMALMLAGVLIGMAVNILSKLALELLGIYAGFPLAVLIAVFGHLFNLLMSIVSGFVHSLRLQYVEFFKQFYSDGGVKFNPLGIKEKYIKIIEK